MIVENRSFKLIQNQMIKIIFAAIINPIEKKQLIPWILLQFAFFCGKPLKIYQ